MAYFVRIRGKAFGPFDEEQLKEMKSKGKLGKLTEVSENKIDWQAAEELSFLFPPAPAPQSSRDLSASNDSRQPAMPGPPLGPAGWFYSLNGTEGYGPVTRNAIVQMLQAGTLKNESLVWQEGQNARPINSEPLFSNVGITANRSLAINAGQAAQDDQAPVGDGQSDVERILSPLAGSLGWMMFLKITFLISIIFMDISYLACGIFTISHAIGADSVQIFLASLLFIAVLIGFCSLATKSVLCFWNYHTDLNRAVANGREPDLMKANRSQSLLWKWSGIFLIYIFVLSLIFMIIAIVAAGLGAGSIERLFSR